ncbi:MAG: bifunctional phosphopantothenoylcysteine decarboxylase/phosphopantothenate--cysteine ligase CoaBC [Candidatus Methanomethylicaceae archaeon]
MKIHPSKDIVGSRSKLLAGRKIAMGICGSVGSVKSPELARALMREGAEVFVFMTEAAQKLISPSLMEWATGNSVVTELTGAIEHVAMGRGGPDSADLILIAPATANTISKMALGIDDTPVTTLATTAIGARIPVVVVPAMHGSMFNHPAVIENLKKLEAMGVTVVQPEEAEGKAKFPPNDVVVEAVISLLAKKDLAGKRILVTAGPTRSYMDAIRYLTNSSSGKMGFAFAREAMTRGGEVVLVTGATEVSLPNCPTIKVTTTEELLDAVVTELRSKKYDLLIMAAAPLDFSISKKSEEKISSDAPVELSLKPLPKIAREARSASSDLFIIGFKAEYGLQTEDLKLRAQTRLHDSGMDLIVANDLSKPSAGFESETNEVYVLDQSGLVSHIPLSAKRDVASKVLDLYLARRGS